jgi:hypothetical protein
MNVAIIPVFKLHAHKRYMLRHCTNIVYIYYNTMGITAIRQSTIRISFIVMFKKYDVL